MKHILLILAISLAPIAFTQKGNTTNAAMAFKSYQQAKMKGDYESAAKDLVEAKEYIDKSYVHADTKNDPKTLMYYGMIYVEIPMCAAISGDEILSAVDVEEATTKGFDALKRSKEVDKKGRYHDDVDAYCNQYRGMLANMGIKLYEEENYSDASAMLIGAAMFGDVMGISDSVYYFYGGIAAYKVDSMEMAEMAFEKTVEWGYQAGTSVYYLSQVYQKLDKIDEAEEMLKSQVAKYPADKDILIELINLYIDADRKADAIAFLNAARELDPGNTVLTYTAGNIYQNMGDFDNAKAAYDDVLSKEPDNANALGAMGGLYYNKAAEISNDANKLEFGDPTFDKMKTEAKDLFIVSVGYFEKSCALMPKDIDMLISLRDSYGKAGMTEEFKATKVKIEELKANK